ncbi:MAG: isoaspartyl peptidase/L-asparaginase [Flavobacteriaceae bacterium]|nr:isoaspartyl peptidase/L-asparaginase [Flavobacteriaceae bacterium]MDG1962653.1 isoaspartyl peptidase/L-asparaginase [Flavobacteriaceae bacterium]
MKNFKIFSVFVSLIVFSCISSDKSGHISTEIPSESLENFGIAIHGGAGTILKNQLSDSLELAYKSKLEEAIRQGHLLLKEGRSALEAVTATINILEDSPLFNAGKGAVFTNRGTNELDASIMDGATLNAGAVAGLTHVKNPINLAHKVMTQSEHVFLFGAGAEAFAATQDIEMVSTDYFYTKNRYNALLNMQTKETTKSALENKSPFFDPYIRASKFGTVGCVALDKNGNLAAGTSTGGMTNKRFDRIGDAPIIGAGTYANNATCAVSSTGWGEYFIRGVVAYDISALMEYKGLTVKEASELVIQEKIPKLGGDGGVIAIDRHGNVSMSFNTPGMYRAHMDKEGQLEVAIYK